MEKYADFCEHIEDITASYPNNKQTFIFKRRTLQDMVSRSLQVKKRGISDDKVAHDLIIDEFNQRKIDKDYKEYLQDLKEEKARKFWPIFAVASTLVFLVIFFILGGMFDLWHPSWLIIENGISVIVFAYMLYIVSLLRIHKKYYFLMRLLVAGSIMVAAQAIFLFGRFMFDIPKFWLIFMFAPALLLVGDLILATVTKQRLIIINYLVCVPGIMMLIYAALGIAIHTWLPVYIVLPAVFAVEILMVLFVILRNKKYSYKPEVDDEWK